MHDRRRHKRLPIKLVLEINELFRQDNELIGNMSEEIIVTDISKTGIGFITKSDIPVEYYFNAKIEFDAKRFFYCVVKILRKVQEEDHILYGCEFIGLAEFLANKVDEYEEIISHHED